MIALTSGWQRLVNRQTLKSDALAGLLGALLVLPQGIAFATLAGLPPQYGLYSAVVPTIVAAVFGSSLHVVSGPTNANSLAIFAAITPLAAAGSPEFIALALAVTVMVGVIQFTVGATRLGGLTDFLSPSVLLGFTGGAATLIACYALPDAFDLPASGGHGAFHEIAYVFEAWRSINPAAAAVAAVTLVVTLVAKQLLRPAPFMLIGLTAGWLVAAIFRWTGVGTPVEVVGAIPTPIPPFSLPIPPLDTLPTLIPLAGALAIIALGQSVSIAKAVAQRSGQRIEVNREFIGQGLSNIAGGFFSSYLSCGSLNRSIPNLEAGARTPLAAVMAAFILIGLVAVASPILRDIPMAAISALLLYTAYSLLEIRRFVEIWKISRIEFAVGIVTFGAMLFFAFHVAILAGVAFSLVAFLHRTSHPHIHSLAPDRNTKVGRFTPLKELKDVKECPQLKLLRIEGATYFGAAQYVSDRLADLRMRSPTQKRLLVMARSMNFIDIAGADVWENELKRRRQMGGDLYFHRPRGPVMAFWHRTGFIERLGLDHFFSSKGDAIGEIYKALDPKICQGCQARIFHECGEGSSTSFFDTQKAGGSRDAKAGQPTPSTA